MSLTLDELVQTAIENQHIVLENELQKGVPLNYIDGDGRYILHYPDGHIEMKILSNNGYSE